MNFDLHVDRSLAFRVAAAPRRPRRLLVLAHGVGGNETNLAPLAAHAPDDTAVVLARAPLPAGPDAFAWFPVTFGADGPRPDLDAAEASRQRLATFVAELQAETRVPPTRTVFAGFSQGGILSASVALTRPDLVRGFGVLAGRILPELEPRLAPRGALRGLRAFIAHGRDDTKLPVDWAHRADAWLTGLGVPHELRLYDAGHAIPAAMTVDFFDWFARATA